MKISIATAFLFLTVFVLAAQNSNVSDISFDWNDTPDQQWPGSDFWAQRMEDWYVQNNTLVSCPQRGSVGWSGLHILTSQLGDEFESFSMQVRMEIPSGLASGNYAGFLVGAGEGRLDHKAASMVFGKPGKGGGILAVAHLKNGLSPLFLDNSVEENDPVIFSNQKSERSIPDRLQSLSNFILQFEAIPVSEGFYDLHLRILNGEDKRIHAEQVMKMVPGNRLKGNVALVFDAPGDGNSKQYFNNFKISGKRFIHNPEHTFGPIAGTLYTISENTLKLSVQCMPVHLSLRSKPVLALEIKNRAGNYEPLSEELGITEPDYCALFRIEDWDEGKRADVRVKMTDTQGKVYYYPVEIRKNPADQKQVSMAVLSDFGHVSRNLNWKIPEVPEGYELVGRWTPANVWFPYKETVDAVMNLDVDFASFTGDQFYENKPLRYEGTSPWMDGLWRWIMWHWAMQPVTSKMPVLIQIDDHGMYQGNVWGDGGKVNPTSNEANGGYTLSLYFLNMIQRICTAHLPDPYDPLGSDAGMNNYYTSVKWGGIGLALLEDRKFKSPPTKENEIPYAELSLLGDRQLQFVNEWGHDWKNEDIKIVLGQTVYANLHTGPDGKIATNDRDGNGWPKPGRDRALMLYRKFNSPVVCGDQHLPSFTLQGIDQPGDGVYQFCTPAAATHFWRWFYPRDGEEGKNRNPGDPAYLGDFTDPFGNYARVLAMKQPATEDVARNHLDFRTWMVIPEEKSTNDTERTNAADGFGVVRFDRSDFTIDFECYPYNYVSGENEQHPGWPFHFSVNELDPREGGYALKTLMIKGKQNPVIQIVDENSGETVKMMRIPAGEYVPRVYRKDHKYTIRVGLPEFNNWKIYENLVPEDKGIIDVEL